MGRAVITDELQPIVRKSGTGLLRTCKQINLEATDILYGVNTFAFVETMHPVRANAYLELPDEWKLLRHLILYREKVSATSTSSIYAILYQLPENKIYLYVDGMNDILQMKDFFKLINASNRAKIRHIKIDDFCLQSSFKTQPWRNNGIAPIGPRYCYG